MNFEIFCYLRHCGVIPVQSFRESDMPPAARIMVKGRPVKVPDCLRDSPTEFRMTELQTTQLRMTEL